MISIPIWVFVVMIVLAAPSALLGFGILAALSIDMIQGLKDE